MIKNIILASKSDIRRKILEEENFLVEVKPSNIDEDEIKISLINNGANCLQIAKSLAEHKANRVSGQSPQNYVLGADQVLDLNNEYINKPNNKDEAKKILLNLNNKKHKLHSALCVSKNGSMIWHYDETSFLTMKDLSIKEIDIYLDKINLDTLKKYGVYQIEGEGKKLFKTIDGDYNSILGMPTKSLISYFTNHIS